ncbi:MAG: taurine ABC transporter substrate-binding protein, partial [Tateyamaria sp.]|nr:taurine ABC transporter substrate-binding protein [Tateyamaria sp.]
MTFKSKLMGAVAATAMLAGAQGAFAAGHGEITVAYFLEWPMPFQYAKETGMYEEAMGTKIN